MNSLQTTKIATPLAGISVTKNTTATTTEIDTIGFKSYRLVATMGVGDCGCSALSISAGDTSGSGYTAITGAALAGAALPTATDDGKNYIFDVTNCGTYGRYHSLILTTINEGAGAAIWSAIAILGEPDQSPNTDAERGNDTTGGYVAV